MVENDGLVMAGGCYGDWAGVNEGSEDFMTVKLDKSNGLTEDWEWKISDKPERLHHGRNHLSGSMLCAFGRETLDRTLLAVGLFKSQFEPYATTDPILEQYSPPLSGFDLHRLKSSVLPGH